MGRIEKKFQKKKDRERAVRKKILKKRADSREFTKQIKERERLERSLSKSTKPKPIRRLSPELQKTLDLVEKIKAEEKDANVDNSDDVIGGPTTAIRGKPEHINYSDDTTVT